MSKRVGGFINQDGLNAPDQATAVSAVAGDTEATVSFTAPADVGGSAVTGYVATSNDGVGTTGSASPITVTGLTNETAYTFRVWAINAFGWSSPSDSTGSVTPLPAAFAFWSGGRTDASFDTNVIQTVNINNLGNATDFGDLTSSRQRAAGCSSATRGVVMGGLQNGGSGPANINFFTMATAGNAATFGNLSQAFYYGGGLSNETRGMVGGGNLGNAGNVIEFITIASTGNSTDFGDLAVNVVQLSGAASPMRGLWAGGFNGSVSVNVIQYVTIASTGNALDFGDMAIADNFRGFCSNATRAVMAGGSTNAIEFVTIATTGNATDFGDLLAIRSSMMGCASTTRALFAGDGNFIEFVTIASTGNSTDFGDLLANMNNSQPAAPCSSAHGGLS